MATKRAHNQTAVHLRNVLLGAGQRPGTYSHPSIVYYARLDRLVKIGTTVRIGTRITEIPTEGIMAVELGARPLERQRHRQFGHLRYLGEWFTLADDLAAHIVTVRNDFEQQEGVTVEEWLAKHLPLTRRRNS